MSEIHEAGDEGGASMALALASAPEADDDDRAPQEVPAWEAATIRLSAMLAIWLGY